MGTIRNEGLETLNLLKQDVTHTRNDVSLFLALSELFSQDSVDTKDFVSIPEAV
jgi:hypothetical protein